MEKLEIKQYQILLSRAVQCFWETRDLQQRNQKKGDQGMRGAVTGGKQLDGFLDLLIQVSKDIGIPEACIYTKGGTTLPGFFRPTKDWDFLVVTPQKQLIAAIEIKSQAGSFGNNFNNRTEEALGSAADLWTIFREGGFSQSLQPWLGYVLVVEKNNKSTLPVRCQEPHFKVRKEFVNASYLDRYAILCKKLMQERHYSSTALIWTNKEMEYGHFGDEISFETFLLSFMGFIQGKLKQFEQ